MPHETISFRRLHPDAILPHRKYCSDAGVDLHSLDPVTIPPYTSVKIPTGLAVEIPSGWYGNIRDRSSHAARALSVLGGVIDPMYRGEIKVVLYNGTSTPQEVGQRTDDGGSIAVAQMVIQQCSLAEPVWADDLSETERGSGGFGSTDSNPATEA